MDSSSGFGPVGRGFMAFHFCKKRGVLEIFHFCVKIYFQGGFARRTRGWRSGERMGRKENRKNKYATAVFPRLFLTSREQKGHLNFLRTRCGWSFRHSRDPFPAR